MLEQSLDHVLGEGHVRVDEQDVRATLTQRIQAQVSTLVLNQRSLQQFQTDGISGVERVIRDKINHAVGVVGVDLVPCWRANRNVVHQFLKCFQYKPLLICLIVVIEQLNFFAESIGGFVENFISMACFSVSLCLPCFSPLACLFL